MAYRLAWSPEAIEDIEAIASYIERDSPWYARAVVLKIVETAEAIPDHPELGRIVPEIDDKSIRERFVQLSHHLSHRAGAHIGCHRCSRQPTPSAFYRENRRWTEI
jgi:toxin ParE1/3/4